MSQKKNYENHSWVLQALDDAQSADHDRRNKAREANAFVDAPDGQWEDRWKEINDNAPRYTFDMVTSLVDQIHSQMSRTSYDIKVRPAGGSATKETAKLYDGMVRNIENISDADQVYDQAGLESIICGVDGWEIATEYVDGDSFDQDLIIKAIPDYLDSTWLGMHKKRDGSDAQYGFVLRGLAEQVFKDKYPNRGDGGNLGSDRTSNTYYHRADVVMIGEFRYLLPVQHELALMDTGEVIEVDADYLMVYDELQRAGSTEIKRRKRTKLKMFSRLFDNTGWIGKPRETFFENWLNIIPVYANWKYVENKVIYRGQVEQGMDAQRVLNYSLSREVAETSLAPKDFFWATEAQEEGQDWSRLNVSQSPVQNYSFDEDAPGPPVRAGGATPNAGLARITETMQAIIGTTAGMFHANMGDNKNAQSGLAIQKLQDKGDEGNNKFMVARQIAQRHTGRILVNAIPRVYDQGRQVRILGEDGSFDMQVLGTQVQDEQTGEIVVLNDLSEGVYDVICTTGPSYSSRQSETVSGITAIAQVAPEVLQLGGDVLMNNMASPGMEQLAARARARLFKAGEIPEDQMTDEEKAKVQQSQQQPPPEDPMMIAAQAEMKSAQAEEISAQTKQMESQGNIQIKMRELEIKSQELNVREFEATTDRYKAQVDAGDKQAGIALKGAQAANQLAEAEGKELENTSKTSGLSSVVQQMQELSNAGGPFGG
jgi:hypothetical protein